MAWTFKEYAGQLTTRAALDILAEDISPDLEIIAVTGGENEAEELFGPGQGSGKEYVLAMVAEDRKERTRTAYIIFVSEDTLNGNKGFWYEETPETMEPAVYCPVKILDLLTPIADTSARNWRERSRLFYEHLEAEGDP